MNIKDGITQRDSRINEHKRIIDQLEQQIKTINPNAEFIKTEYSTKLVYYTVSVIASKIKTSKQVRDLYIKDDALKLLNGKYLTKLDAENAIKEVILEAENKFNDCLEAFIKLERSMGFIVGFNYDGDSHGIYNEYQYISFKLKGFDFQFQIDS